MVDGADLRRTPLGENASRMTLGGTGEESFLICGGMTIEPSWHPLVTSLPPVILVRMRDRGPSRWLTPLLGLLKAEAGAGRAGGDIVITRLVQVLVVAALREWMDTAEVQATRCLVAVRHEQIGRAISAVHSTPHRRWTLHDLAARAGMSRSVFAVQFAELCGLPPIQYVAHWRMNLAADWLRQTRLPMAELADRLGYSSEATFGRAFKRSWGIPPGHFRRDPLPERPFIGADRAQQPSAPHRGACLQQRPPRGRRGGPLRSPALAPSARPDGQYALNGM